MSRAVRTLATALACLGAAASGFAARTSLLVLTATDRFEVPAQPRGRADWVALRALGDKLRLSPRAEGSSLRLTWGDRELVVSDRKNVASTAGQMTLLSAPCTFEAGDWWVPADSLEPLFGPLLQISVRYRPAQRALLLGNPPVPRVTIGQMVTPDGVDITLDASSPVAFHMTRPEDSVVVSFGDAVVDVDMRASSASTGDILEAVRLVQGTETSLVMTLGPRFLDVRASEPDAGRRLVLNFSASAVEPGPVAGAVPARPAGAGLRTIVIDPGHGGADSGALGPGGVTEKAIVLRFAQQLRASLTSGLGLQVVLTREKDEDVELDARPGIANNFKAQLFVSLHAGSRQSGGWPGPRVYTRSIIEEILPQTQPPVAGLETWSAAQAPNLAIAAPLAAELQTRLVSAMGQGQPAPRAAALRVLAGAAMPAVLIELGCLDDPKDAARLASDAGQQAVISALVAVLSRYSPVERQP